MDVLKDILDTNKSIISKSFKLMGKNWPIIFTGFVYSVVLGLLWSMAPLFGILAGILITAVQSTLISNYLYLVENIIRYGKITIEDFKQGFRVYLWKVYGILVVIWFVNYGAGLFLRPILNIRIGFLSLWLIVQFVAFVVLNSLPEVIYQKHYAVGESFVYAFEFIRENWIDWFVPNILLFGIVFFIGGWGLVLGIFVGGGLRALTPTAILSYGIGQLLLSFIMIYRGLLFNILSTTSRRKRMYMRNVYR